MKISGLTVVHCDEKKCRYWEQHPHPIENWDGLCAAESVSVLSGECVQHKTDKLKKLWLKNVQKQTKIDTVTKWERGKHGAGKRKERKSLGKNKPRKKKIRNDEELRALLL